jgi:multiple sugar transport system substrate-binding protein
MVGCTTGGASEPEKTEITFLWLWGEAEDQVLRDLVVEFNEMQDEIVVTGVSSPDTVKQLAAMTSSNPTFDVSDFFGNWTAAWAEMGILEPLDEYIERDNFDMSDFIGPTLEQNQYNGQTWSLPIGSIVLQLYYNKDLLAEAGFDGPPETLEELGVMTQALTKTDAEGNITQLGLYGPWPAAIMNPLAYAFGGSFYGLGDGSSGPQPTSEGTAAALEFFSENVIEPVGADKLTEFISGFGSAFTADFPLYNGKVAMYIDGAYHNAQIPTFAPDLNYGVAPIPYPADRPELAGTTGIDNSTIFIPANSQKKEAAWEFVKFLYERQNVLDFVKSQTNLPPLISGIDDPTFADLPEGFGTFLDALRSPNLVASPAQPWNGEYTNELNVLLDGFVSGRASVDETIAAFEAAAEKFR